MENYTDDFALTFNGKKYYLDLIAMKQFCTVKSSDDNREKEITEVYNTNENYELELASRVDREVKSNNKGQDDVIVYDIIKFCIESLFSVSLVGPNVLSMANAIAFNTLMKFGILVEVNND